MSIIERDGAGGDHLADEVRTAFAAGGLDVSLHGIRARARARTHRLAATTAVAAAAVIAAGIGAVATGTGQRATALSPPATHDAACRAQWGDPAYGAQPKGSSAPPVVLYVRDGVPGAIVYGDARHAGICAWDTADPRDAHFMDWLDSARVQLAGQPEPTVAVVGSTVSLGNTSGPDYVWGVVRPDVTHVDLRLDSGPVTSAARAGEYFGYLDPAGGHRHLLISAVRPGGTYAQLISSSPPTGASPSTTDAPDSGRCADSIATLLAQAPDLTVAQRAQHPRQIPGTTHFVTDRAYFTCGGGQIVQAWMPALPFSAQAHELSLLLPAWHDNDGWAAGHPPAGTQRVDVVLTDGTNITADFFEGFYYASWTGARQIDRVVAYTADRVYTHHNGVTTVAAR